MNYSSYIIPNLILISILILSISCFFIAKTFMIIKSNKQKNVVRTQDDRIDNISSVIDISDKLLSYIDRIVLLEIKKVILKSERVGKRYDVTRLTIDSESICDTVLSCINDETMTDIVAIFGKEWILSYISSNVFMLLVSLTSEYNDSIGPSTTLM